MSEYRSSLSDCEFKNCAEVNSSITTNSPNIILCPNCNIECSPVCCNTKPINLKTKTKDGCKIPIYNILRNCYLNKIIFSVGFVYISIQIYLASQSEKLGQADRKKFIQQILVEHDRFLARNRAQVAARQDREKIPIQGHESPILPGPSYCDYLELKLLSEKIDLEDWYEGYLGYQYCLEDHLSPSNTILPHRWLHKDSVKIIFILYIIEKSNMLVRNFESKKHWIILSLCFCSDFCLLKLVDSDIFDIFFIWYLLFQTFLLTFVEKHSVIFLFLCLPFLIK